MGSSARPPEVTLKPKAPPAPLLRAGMATKLAIRLGSRDVTLFEDKITVRDQTGGSETLPRRYTVTHSERSADLSLSVGGDYDLVAPSEPDVREKGDELVAELTNGAAPRLTVRCAVQPAESRAGRAAPHRRRQIFEREMLFVLASIRYGDRFFFERHPELDKAEVVVQFGGPGPAIQDQREFGRITDYRVTRITGESRRLVVGAAAIAAIGVGALVVGKLRNRSG